MRMILSIVLLSLWGICHPAIIAWLFEAFEDENQNEDIEWTIKESEKSLNESFLSHDFALFYRFFRQRLCNYAAKRVRERNFNRM